MQILNLQYTVDGWRIREQEFDSARRRHEKHLGKAMRILRRTPGEFVGAAFHLRSVPDHPVGAIPQLYPASEVRQAHDPRMPSRAKSRRHARIAG
jgi:ribosomal protein L16/L10AE